MFSLLNLTDISLTDLEKSARSAVENPDTIPRVSQQTLQSLPVLAGDQSGNKTPQQLNPEL